MVPISTTIVRMLSPTDNSYEMICAPLRMAPISENLLLEPQPASRMPITPMLDADRRKNIPTLKFNTSIPLLMGRQVNVRNEAMITMNGARL